MAVIKKRLQIN